MAFIAWAGLRQRHYAGLKYRYLMIVLFFAGLAATAYMYVHVPTGFVPQEDQNYFIVVVQAPRSLARLYDGRV